MPTVEDIAPKLTKAKVFSVVDVKDGFLQVVLNEPSSYLTTFCRFTWLRMPFGIKSSTRGISRTKRTYLHRGVNRYANHVAFTTFAQIYSRFFTILITFALSKFGSNPFSRPVRCPRSPTNDRSSYLPFQVSTTTQHCMQTPPSPDRQ